MQKNKTKILIASLVCIIALMGVAIAQILMTRQITNNMRMLGAANFKLIREDTYNYTTGYYDEVTEITWGDFTPLQSKTSLSILGTRINIINLGNIGLVFGWNVTDLDPRWTLTCTWGGSTPFPENDYDQFGITPGGVNGYLTFTLTSVDEYHPPEDVSFTVSFYAKPQP